MTVLESPLTLMGFEENTDLRTVSWNQGVLEDTAKSWNLKHGQAVIFSNAARNKIRLIAVFYGMAVLILPPIDPADKISLYLKVNEFLHKFTKNVAITDHINSEIDEARARLERQHERKAMAKKAERNRSK
ncbi:hypothetical protein MUP59_06055 [Candidatus Bathyarchaeota archaeon]|nr:hypothetical protein [Candidatus Bathyarchaeota archaeon]